MTKIKYSTVIKGLLYIIIIGCENAFYLIDSSKVNIAGVINYTDIFVFLAIVLFIMTFWIYRKHPKCKYKFGWIIISLIILSIYSSIQSKVLYDQSFVMGLRPQRFLIVWGLIYFPIRRLIYLKELTIQDIKKMIFIIGTCEIILYSTQYFLTGKVKFLYVLANKRYGDNRYYFDNLLLRILLFINLDLIFKKKKIIRSIIYIAAILFIIMIIEKMRMTSLSTILAMSYGIFIWKKGGQVKVGILVLVVIAGTCIYNLDIVQDTLNTILSDNSNKSTLSIRDLGRELYIESLRNHPILGCGYPNVLNEKASKNAGFNKLIYLVDNGLWGYAYIYGGIGLIWVLLLFGNLIQNGWKIYRKYDVYYPFLIILSWLISAQTEAHWYWNNGFIYVAIILTIVEQYMPLKQKQNTDVTIL